MTVARVFLNLNNSFVMFWLVEVRAKSIYLLFFLFILVSVVSYYNWVIRLVGEGMNSPMTPRLGIRSQCVHPDQVFFLYVIFFIYFPILFSILIYFLTLLFLVFWKSVKHQRPLFLSLEFNDDFIYFIWSIFDRLLESWKEGLMKSIIFHDVDLVRVDWSFLVSNLPKGDQMFIHGTFNHG